MSAWLASAWMVIAGLVFMLAPARLFGSGATRVDIGFYQGCGTVAWLAALLGWGHRPLAPRVAAVLAALIAILFFLLAVQHPPGFGWIIGLAAFALLSAAAARVFWKAHRAGR